MGKIYTGSSPLSKVYDVTINAPLDNRVAVRYIADLTTGENGGIAAQVYKGMIVYVQEDNSLYIYIGLSSNRWQTSTGKLVNGGDIKNWKKLDSFLDPSINLQYYAEKIGAKIFETEDELIGTIDSPYKGMFALVIGDSDETTVEETGLYVLLDNDNTNVNNWLKINSGSGDFVTRDELNDYIKKNELPDFLTSSDLDGYVKKEELDGYVKPEDIADLVNKSDLDGYVKVEDVVDYLTSSDLEGYATTQMVSDAISTKADSIDVYTKDEVDEKIGVLPKEGSFPDLDSADSDYTSGYATVDGVIDYVADVLSHVSPDSPDFRDYATKDYVDDVIGSLDIPEHSEVLTTNGTQPTSGSGLSVSNSQDNAFIEEIYVDDYLHANVYYTSKGINKTKKNGGSELEGIGYITLSNEGNSWISLDDEGTMKLYIADDSLGFNVENIIGIIDNDGEHINPYDGHPYTESPIILSLNNPIYIKFDVDVDFTGFTETRDDDTDEYIFGQSGSSYDDIDFYSVNTLPTVNAYVDGVSTRVLTEGDKIELTNMIDNKTSIQPISTQEILDLFP